MPLAAPAGVTAQHSPSGAPPSTDRVLTPQALAFVADLERRFGDRRRELLLRRQARQRDLDDGAIPGFLVETRAIREAGWRVGPTPPALERRRVEITGPVERKMMINALNSGADAFMADFEDALSPTWENVVEGQANVQDAVRGTIDFTGPDGRRYALGDEVATLILRPRGWHLEEAHLLVDDKPMSASLFDFGLSFFHNAADQLARGFGPYYYLPKLESHLEARLWNDVFVHAQQTLGIPQGSVKATVLIETILGAFEMEEILYELRDHAAGLNAGRWDYIFSIIKKFSGRPDMLLPDRAQVTMAVPFMRAYTEQLVRTCHRRGAHAMGGMAAFVPNRRDAAVTEAAVAKVREDKQREAGAGFDGTWVAHPDLVPVAMEVFVDALGDRPNQKERQRDDVHPDAASLISLAIPGGRITDAGVRANVDVALLYIDAWLRGSGAVAIHNLMEDAATAEISRAQLWQWLRHGATTSDGTTLTPERYAAVRDEVLATLEAERGDAPSRLRDAAELLDGLVLGAEFTPFLTLPAYPLLEQAPVAVAAESPGAPDGTIDATTSVAVPPAAATAFAQEVDALDARWNALGTDAPRRDYAADDVARLRGSVRVVHTIAELGAERLRTALAARMPLVAAADVAAGADAIVVTGGPDRVRKVSDALLRADRIAWASRVASSDAPDAPLAPIIAELQSGRIVDAYDDACALIAAGAAAIVVAADAAEGAVRAARLAADVLDVPTVIIARALADARYADALSLGTATCDLEAARRFATAARATHPNKPLMYECATAIDSSSADGVRRELGALGYTIVQFGGAGGDAHGAEAHYRELVRATIEQQD